MSVNKHFLRGRVAQRDMENGTVLRVVDVLTRKHRRTTTFDIGSNSEFLEEPDRLVIDPAF